MTASKETTQSFIVRLWLEPREQKDKTPEWRGVIENVANGERIYFINFEQVTLYLSSYLEAMGVNLHSA